MATEIALLKLKPDTNLKDDGPARTTWQETLTTVLEQDGAQRAYWGVAVEDPNMLRLFIDWDSVAAHQKFMSSETYGPFGQKLMTILDGIAGLSHANLSPHPPSAALASPATELLTMYFPKDYTSAQMDKFTQTFAQLVVVIEQAGADSYTTSASGWLVEDEATSPANPEHSGKAFFAAIGWKSVQHHLDFRNTAAFKDNIHLLRGADGVLGVHVQHYLGTEVQRGAGGK